ncbi:hypothetical protein IG631_20937 [Alternaria alternata]|jgi:hypothetical protein|nr:hypothetical protein IG631_20937 [Alternaria alternata]
MSYQPPAWKHPGHIAHGGRFRGHADLSRQKALPRPMPTALEHAPSIAMLLVIGFWAATRSHVFVAMPLATTRSVPRGGSNSVPQSKADVSGPADA